MERPPRARRSLSSSPRQALLRRYSTVRTHLSRGDAEFFIAEDVIGKDVCNTKDQHQNTAGDDDAPEGGAKGFLGCSLLIEISEDRYAEDYHERAKGDETRRGGEERPIRGDVVAEKWKLGDNETDL